MQTCTSWILFLHVFFYLGSAFAAPSSLNYQGRILKSDGTPLEYNSVSFIFQITDPSGACVIYQEQVNGYNMVNSRGVFDIAIGNGAVTYPTSGTFTVLDAFNNGNTFTCYGGSPYVASVNDLRKLRVQFHDGLGWNSITPDSVIRSVPFAGYSLSAQKLGTNTVSDFILKTGIPTCLAGTFLTWDGTALSCSPVSGASGGTVTNVLSANSYITVANGTSTPALTLNVGTTANTVAAGNDTRIVNAMQTGASASGDLSGNYPAPTVSGLQGVGISSAVPSSGQVLKFNGTNWAPASSTAGTVTSVTASAPLASSGGATPNITLSQATTSTNGYLSSTDWNTFNNKQAAGNYVTALSGDVIASGPGSAAATIEKLQGSTLTLTAPTSGQYVKYNGTAFVNSALSSSDLSGNIPASLMPAFTGDVTSSAGSTVLTLSSVGTAGTYYKVTTDSKGRVTSGSASLVAGDIPGLPWSQITSGKPTTLSGYGITDSVLNAGNAVSIQSGNDASKGAASTNGRFYFATDTQKIYFDNGASWIAVASNSGTGGTVTSVTSANSDISIATTTSTPLLTLNSGTNPNQIVKLDGSAKLPIVDGSALTNLNASSLASGTLSTSVLPAIPVTKGGTGLTSGTSGGIPYFSSSSSMASSAALTANGVLLGGGAGASPIATSAGVAYQPLRVPAGGGAPAFGAIDISQSAAVTGVLPITNGGTGASSLAANRLLGTNGTGTVQQVVTCPVNQILSFDASGNYGCYTVGSIFSGFVNGGNTFGATSNLGNNDNFDLNIKTNNLTRMTVQATGNVGIGTSTPGSALDVSGTIRADVLCDRTGANCKTVSAGWGNVSAASMVANWPDTIICDNGTDKSIMYHDTRENATNLEYYSKASSGHYIRFNATTGAFYDNTAFTGNSVCTNKSISTLVAEGRTFGLLGGGVDWTPTGANVYRAGGNVGIGTSTPISQLNVLDTIGGAPRGISNEIVGNNSWGPGLGFYKARGTPAAKTSPVATDGLGYIWFTGWNGSSYSVPSLPTGLSAFATENWDATHSGSGLSFYTVPNGATSGATRMTIDQNGNVGIGAPNPATKLDINGTAQFGGNKGYIGYYNVNPYDQAEFGAIGASTSLSLVTNSISRLNITPSGSVGIGNINPFTKLHVTGDIAATGWVGAGCEGACDTGGGYALMYADGHAVATVGWTTTSDERLKTDIKPMKNPLDKILRLHSVNYRWRDTARTQQVQNGLIAQNVHEIFPDLVSKNEDGFLSVDYGRLTAPLIGAIKQLHDWLISHDQKIVHLEAENAKKETENIQIKRDLASLKEASEQTAKENKLLKDYLCTKDPEASFCGKK